MGAAARDLRRLVAQGGPKLTRAALPAKQFVSIHTSIKRCRGFFSAPPRAARERWKFCLVRLRVLELTTAHQRPFQDDIAVKPPGLAFVWQVWQCGSGSVAVLLTQNLHLLFAQFLALQKRWVCNSKHFTYKIQILWRMFSLWLLFQSA